MRILVVLFSLMLANQVLAKDSPCAEKTYAGEGLLDKQQTQKAESVLKEAVEICRNSNEKSARPYIALGKLYFDTNKCDKAIPLFEEALKEQPGLSLAYMNLSACYFQLTQYEKAAEAGLPGTKSKDNDIAFKASYNVAIAYFNQALKTSNFKDLRSEAYFLKVVSLNPNFSEAYKFLGTIERDFKHNIAEAKKYFKMGCDKHSNDSCSELSSMDSKAAAAVDPDIRNDTDPAACGRAGSLVKNISSQDEYTQMVEKCGHSFKINFDKKSFSSQICKKCIDCLTLFKTMGEVCSENKSLLSNVAGINFIKTLEDNVSYKKMGNEIHAVVLYDGSDKHEANEDYIKTMREFFRKNYSAKLADSSSGSAPVANDSLTAKSDALRDKHKLLRKQKMELVAKRNAATAEAEQKKLDTEIEKKTAEIDKTYNEMEKLTN